MTKRVKQTVISAALPAVMLTTAMAVQAQTEGNPNVNHPAPNARVIDWTLEVVNGGTKSIYKSNSSIFPEQSFPFQEDGAPSNLLPTIYENMIDGGGDRVPNSLPSTPENPYNLHEDPEVSDINGISPRMDLERIINKLETAVFPSERAATNREFFPEGEGVPADPRRGSYEKVGEDAGTIEEVATGRVDMDDVQMAIDILEGNRLEDRVYSGMALLNYTGPEKVKTVDPATRTVTVHQMWMRQRIKSDTMFIDPSAVQDVPWTVRYVIDVSHWGHEDFAPFGVYFDDPQDNGGNRFPFFMMDQSFFPMEKDKRYVFEVKMPPARYWNLTYHWGWRVHPPRIQAIENALKKPLGKSIVQWETEVFGENPRATEQSKLAAISMLSDLSPAKRMWSAFRAIRSLGPVMEGNGSASMRPLLAQLVNEARAAFEDWKDRTSLPRGVEFADGYDETLFYANNTLYGVLAEQDHPEFPKAYLGENEMAFEKFQTRGTTLDVKLLNGDYYPHTYQNVDFGGRRGYENIYQNTLPIGGQGPWFTFGRAQWWPNTMRPAIVPAAERQGLQLNIPGVMAKQSPAPMRKVAPIPEIAMKKRDRKAMDAMGTIKYLQHSGERIKVARTADGIGWHDVELTFRFDPSLRLRFYQFDPTHHNTNIFSIH